MSEVTSLRRQQQDELSDMQTEFARKKKRAGEQNEAELEDIHRTHEARKESVEEQGRAAINHIRKAQGDAAETAENQRKVLEERSQTNMGKIDDTYRKKTSEMVQNREALLSASREKTRDELAKLDTTSEDRLARLREHANDEYLRTKNASESKLATMKRAHDERFENEKLEANQAEDREKNRGADQLAKLSHENEDNYAKTRKFGEEKLATEEQILARKQNRLETESQHDFDKKKATWANRKDRLDNEYVTKLGEKKDAYEAQMKLQQKHFESTYTKNGEANAASLRLQSLNATKELNEIKKGFLETSAKYEGKAQDPFYRVEDRGSRLLESPSFYFVEAYAPEHEKDDIRVVLEKDRVIVQGQRSFQDKLETDSGKKVSASSFQSFREELPLEKPISNYGVSRERDGDWIRLTVPKLTGFSRKA